MNRLSRVLPWLLFHTPIVIAAAPDGADLYAKNCASCHETLMVIQNHVALKAMSPEYIVRALTNGPMRVQAARLTNPERVAIAEYLTGKSLEAASSGTTGTCSSEPPKGIAGPQWNGWGV